MSWHQVKRMPIVDSDHKVIGIVSTSDVTRYLCDHNDWRRRIAFATALWQLGGQTQVSPDFSG
jgi:CBS-domain-containing membrane protein